MVTSYILPFIGSIKSVFSTMLQLSVTCGSPVRESAISSARSDVSGIIGMSGDMVGAVVLCFPMESARKVVAKFVGADVGPDTEDFGDAIGELLNMICGGAKAKFEGKHVSISCPSVVVGCNHKVQQMSDSACIRIPCSTEYGDFSVEVNIKESSPNNVIGAETQASTAS